MWKCTVDVQVALIYLAMLAARPAAPTQSAAQTGETSVIRVDPAAERERRHQFAVIVEQAIRESGGSISTAAVTAADRIAALFQPEPSQ